MIQMDTVKQWSPRSEGGGEERENAESLFNGCSLSLGTWKILEIDGWKMQLYSMLLMKLIKIIEMQREVLQLVGAQTLQAGDMALCLELHGSYYI